jgi:hypothetical protein
MARESTAGPFGARGQHLYSQRPSGLPEPDAGKLAVRFRGGRGRGTAMRPGYPTGATRARPVILSAADPRRPRGPHPVTAARAAGGRGGAGQPDACATGRPPRRGPWASALHPEMRTRMQKEPAITRTRSSRRTAC